MRLRCGESKAGKGRQHTHDTTQTHQGLTYVGKHASPRQHRGTDQLVELLVVVDGELEVARGDADLLVVARGVAGELEDLGRQVLEHRGQVDGGAGGEARGVAACCRW